MEKITFYIGRSGKDMGKTVVSEKEIQEFIQKFFDGGTFFSGKGLWKGKTEDTLVFEVLNFAGLSKEDIIEVKEALESEFNQESVLTTVEEVQTV